MWSRAGLRYAQSEAEELAGLELLEAGLSTTAAGISMRSEPKERDSDALLHSAVSSDHVEGISKLGCQVSFMCDSPKGDGWNSCFFIDFGMV